MRTSLRRIGGALIAALLAMSVAPAPASAVGGSTTVCAGTVSGTYSPALTPIPSLARVQLSLSSTTLSCDGPATHSLTLSAVTGDQLAGASCTGPVAFVGSGSLGTDTVTARQVQWVAAGTMPTQSWGFVDTGDVPPGLDAAGVAAVLDSSQITACLFGSVSSVTFTVVLAIVA